MSENIKDKQKPKPSEPRPYPVWVPFTLVFFGFLLRLLAMTRQETISIDSVRYIQFAKSYLSGIFNTIGPTGLRELPDIGYPILIAILARIFGGDLEASAWWISLISGTLTLILIYMIALRFAGWRPAIYTLFIAATCLPLISYSSLIQTESLFILLLAVNVYLSYIARKRELYSFWFIIGGISSAYAYITRGIGIIFLVIFPLSVWLMGFVEGDIKKDRTKTNLRFTVGIIGFIIGFMIIAFPYQIMLYRTYNRFVLSDQSIWHTPRVLHPEINFNADPRYDGTLTSDGTEYLINTADFYDFPKASPITKIKAFVSKYLKNQIGIYYYHLRELFSPLYLFLIALGLFASPWEPKFKNGLILFGIWSIPFLLLQPFYYTEARYIAPVTIFLLVIAGRGIVACVKWLALMMPKRDYKCIEWGFAIVLFIILTPMMIYPITHRGYKYDYIELRDAGYFLAGYIHGAGGAGVMAVTPLIGYYADISPNLVLPDADIETILKFAKAKGVDYIALDERKVYPFRPQLRALLYTDTHPPNLELIYNNADNQGYRVRIFKIMDL